MSTETTPALPFADAIPADLAADNDALIDKLTTGKPLDPETHRRIRERAERATAELRQKYGEVSLAVDLVRQTRDGE